MPRRPQAHAGQPGRRRSRQRPSQCQVRGRRAWMRSAISPRLAMRIFVKSGDGRSDRKRSILSGLRIRKPPANRGLSANTRSDLAAYPSQRRPPVSLFFSSLALRVSMAFSRHSSTCAIVILAGRVRCRIKIGLATIHQLHIRHGVVIGGTDFDRLMQILEAFGHQWSILLDSSAQACFGIFDVARRHRPACRRP